MSTLSMLSEQTKEGTTFNNLNKAAETLGFDTFMAHLSYEQLEGIDLPCILHWNADHYVVLYKIDKFYAYLSDPALGKIKHKKERFLEIWLKGMQDKKGVALLLAPTNKFYTENKYNKKGNKYSTTSEFIKLIYQNNFHAKLIYSIIIYVLSQFLTAIYIINYIDINILQKSLSEIILIITPIILLFITNFALETKISYTSLRIGEKYRNLLIFNLFKKIENLRFDFFELKQKDEAYSLFKDVGNLRHFYSNSSIEICINILTYILMNGILIKHNTIVFLILNSGSIIHIYNTILLKKRNNANESFIISKSAEISRNINELIEGILEIKIHNLFERIHNRINILNKEKQNYENEAFNNNTLTSINRFIFIYLNISIITLILTNNLLNEQINLGVFIGTLYCVYVIHNLGENFQKFLRKYPTYSKSIKRQSTSFNDSNLEDFTKNLNKKIDKISDIHINNLSYRFYGSSTNVLENISFTIPKNKVTAIVGSSGSGKSTLLKILLKIYTPSKGNIYLGANNLNNYNIKEWHSKCGIVFQEGKIFNDTIVNNIALDKDLNKIDYNLVNKASKMAKLHQFIKTLPRGYETLIGEDGKGLSSGQKQRILIARTIYKNTPFIFLDEATSALDSENEKHISEELWKYFESRTVIIIAHRLSTVKNADQIIVLNEGKICEIDTHSNLLQKKGRYYQLIQNQMIID